MTIRRSMDKYMDEIDARRYLELLKKSGHLSIEEDKELGGLMDKSLAKQREIFGEPQHAPFEGKCWRCGKEFDNPVPEVTHPEGRMEIICCEWCAGCNQFVATVVLRWASAYRVEHPHDPVRGGEHART